MRFNQWQAENNTPKEEEKPSKEALESKELMREINVNKKVTKLVGKH